MVRLTCYSMTSVTGEPVAVPPVWSSPAFRRLWRADAVSTFGSEISELALPLLALGSLGASAAELSIIRSAGFLPFLLATIPLGLLADRRRRLPLMVVADAGRFVLLTAIPVAVWLGVASVPLVAALVLAAGCLSVLYETSSFSVLPDVVAPEQLVDANAKLTATESGMNIGGGGVAGLLVQTVTAPVAVLVDAASFLVSALTLRRLRIDEPDRCRAEGSTWTDALAGVQLVRRSRTLRALAGEAATWNAANELYVLGLTLLVVRDRNLGAAVLGAALTAGGAGTFIGAWYGTRISSRFGYGHTLVGALLVGNTAPLLVAIAPQPTAAFVALLVGASILSGLGIGMANSHAVSVRQLVVPDELRARANAGYRLISWGAIPLGAAVAGLLATTLGARPTLTLGASGMALATIWIAASPLRHLRTIADTASPDAPPSEPN